MKATIDYIAFSRLCQTAPYMNPTPAQIDALYEVFGETEIGNASEFFDNLFQSTSWYERDSTSIHSEEEVEEARRRGYDDCEDLDAWEELWQDFSSAVLPHKDQAREEVEQDCTIYESKDGILLIY